MVLMLGGFFGAVESSVWMVFGWLRFFHWSVCRMFVLLGR